MVLSAVLGRGALHETFLSNTLYRLPIILQNLMHVNKLLFVCWTIKAVRIFMKFNSARPTCEHICLNIYSVARSIAFSCG